MARDTMIQEVLTELRALRTDLGKLREEVAGYRGSLATLKWLLGLVTVPTLAALVWVLKKVGVIVA